MTTRRFELVVPGAVLQAELGHLDVNVRLARHRLHASAPGGEAIFAAVPGKAGMVQHDRDDAGTAAPRRQPRRGANRARGDPTTAGTFAVARSPQPFVVLHGARRAGRRGIGAKGRHRLRPDSTHQRKLRLGSENLFRIVGVEPGVRDDGAGKAATRIHVGQPLRLGDLLGAIHLGFAMHRRQHVVGARIPQIVFRQVVSPDRVVRPQEEVRFRLVGQGKGNGLPSGPKDDGARR